MQNFEQLGRELERRGKADMIKELAQSDDGIRLGQMVDTSGIAQAARSGDSEALKRMISQVLGTDEGRRIAENIKKMMDE